MKYIMFESEYGQKISVIFPNVLVHELVAEGVGEIASKHGFKVSPSSAGFVDIGLNVSTFGESESMGMASNLTDASYIALGDSVSFAPPPFAKMAHDAMKKREEYEGN